jgi:hypothetical protein
MKRATGGRAESFSPDVEEFEETADEPLEPGTDAPLNSALTGAPSSDTALMSGARGRGKLVAPAAGGSDLRPARPANVIDEAVDPDDFLAAARRAAKAASAEAVEAERDEQSRGLTRIMGLIKTHRRAVLASVLALAVAVAAYRSCATRWAPIRLKLPLVPDASPAAVEAPGLRRRAAPRWLWLLRPNRHPRLFRRLRCKPRRFHPHSLRRRRPPLQRRLNRRPSRASAPAAPPVPTAAPTPNTADESEAAATANDTC